jgi:Superinfection immunity protein
MVDSVLTSAALVAISAFCAGMYLLPALVAWLRHAPDIGSVAVINVLLGWTLLGWVLALAMALRTANPAGPFVQVVQNPPAAPSQPPALPPAGWAGPPGPPELRPGPPPLDLPPRPPGTGDPAGRGDR